MYCTTDTSIVSTADNVQWSARGARGREGGGGGGGGGGAPPPPPPPRVMSAASAGRRHHARTTAASQHATRRTDRKHLMLWHIRGWLGRCAFHGPSRHPAGCSRGCKGAHRLSGQLGEAAAAPADVGAHILESLERHRRHAVVQDGSLLPSPLLPELGGREGGGGRAEARAGLSVIATVPLCTARGSCWATSGMAPQSSNREGRPRPSTRGGRWKFTIRKRAKCRLGGR
jgi:hypothetical protein